MLLWTLGYLSMLPLSSWQKLKNCQGTVLIWPGKAFWRGDPFKNCNLWFSIFTTRSLFSGSTAAAAAAKLLQSCLTLCNPIDGSPPGSAVPGILQARTLEWVAISFSIAWKWKVKVKSLSRIQLIATPWTAAHQAPPSMGFSRQEHWSGLPLPSPLRKYTSP